MSLPNAGESSEDTKDKDDTDTGERAVDMDVDVDEPIPMPASAPIASASAAAATASLLDLFAVASSPPVPLAPSLPQITTNGTDANDNTESEGEAEFEGELESDEGEGDEEKLMVDTTVQEDLPVQARHRELDAVVLAPVEDGPVSPISHDADEPESPSREVSPMSDRSVDEEGAEEDGDEPDDGEKSDGEAEDAVNKSEEKDADIEDADAANKSNADVDDAEAKSDIEADADKSDAEAEADKSDEEMDGDVDADVEMEVQSSHCVEALDMLAGIELKYALLSKVVYLERMEGVGMGNDDHAPVDVTTMQCTQPQQGAEPPYTEQQPSSMGSTGCTRHVLPPTFDPIEDKRALNAAAAREVSCELDALNSSLSPSPMTQTDSWEFATLRAPTRSRQPPPSCKPPPLIPPSAPFACKQTLDAIPVQQSDTSVSVPGSTLSVWIPSVARALGHHTTPLWTVSRAPLTADSSPVYPPPLRLDSSYRAPFVTRSTSHQISLGGTERPHPATEQQNWFEAQESGSMYRWTCHLTNDGCGWLTEASALLLCVSLDPWSRRPSTSTF
ncbi:hypothetical protein K438DRAFT_1954123 [Mycena galopus ATCC 62051]|nr:hypothetical protein K438DRAFT_1954123 [Mycena galopus ATCC 62051]